MDIEPEVIEELNRTLKEINETNREQGEFMRNLLRNANDPNYKGGSFSGFGDTNLTFDLTKRLFDKLGAAIDSLKGPQGASSGGGRMSGAASHPDTNPAAQVARQNVEAIMGQRATGGSGPSAQASKPNFAIRAARQLQIASEQVPAAANVAANYAYDINRSVIQPARKYGAFQTGLTQMGELQGLSGAGGDISIGGIGMRTPFGNQAFMRGVGMKLEAFKDSVQAGITRGQAENIQKSVIGAGYKQGTTSYNAMKNMFQTATQMSSVIGQDPRFQEMAIAGTRFGGASQEDVLETLKGIKDATENSNISLGQMLEDSQQYARLVQQTGGGAATGMSMGYKMSALTGLPGQTTLAMQNNPFVQAKQMQTTGLMPWQLGQMSAEQRTSSTYQAFDMLSRQLGPSGPTTKRVDAGGFTHISSGSDKQDATIAMMMGVDINVVKQMRKNKRQVMRRARASDVFTGYEETGQRILESKNLTDVEKRARLHAMETGTGRGTIGELKRQMQAAGASSSQIAKVMEAGSDIKGGSGHAMLKRAQARSQAFQDWAGGESGMETGPKVTVELSKDAKKLLKIKSEDSSGLNKALAGIGDRAVIQIARSAPGIGQLLTGAEALGFTP